MIALVDADIVCYRVGFTTENESEAIAHYRANELLDNILIDTGAKEFRLFLSDSAENNFRYKVDPKYKANRTAPKPKHLNSIKEHLIVSWGAKIAHGMEADDYLGINQREDTIICSIDKDLLQIPGSHYNFVTRKFSAVSIEEGYLSFYRSILTGDKVDNIMGIYGVGPVRAEEILPEWKGEYEAIWEIVKAYGEGNKAKKTPYEPEEIAPTILKNGRLLKIKQSEDEPLWDSKYLRLTDKPTVLSTLRQVAESNQSTELTTPDMRASDGFPVAGQKKEDTKQMQVKAP